MILKEVEGGGKPSKMFRGSPAFVTQCKEVGFGKVLDFQYMEHTVPIDDVNRLLVWYVFDGVRIVR